jgi:hypothetical protein
MNPRAQGWRDIDAFLAAQLPQRDMSLQETSGT